MRFLRCPLWLGLLACCACALSVRAQAQGILIPASFYAVQGAPFSLTFEIRSDPPRDTGPTQLVQRILRDSAGRQRYEAPVEDGIPRSPTAGIYDVVASQYIRLDLDAKTAEVKPIHVGRPVTLDVSVASSLAPLTPAPNQTLLGTRQIDGLEAWGQRTVRTISLGGGPPITQDRELWLSTHYRMPVMQVMHTDRGTTTQAVVSFTPGEPDPALFQIPPGFTVKELPPDPAPAPGTARIGPNVSAPQVLHSAEPEFSQEARRKKVSGSVVLHLIVDEQGLPQNITVVHGLGSGLDEKAIEAVKQYRFRPAMRQGQPVKVEINIDVNFQIFGKQ